MGLLGDVVGGVFKIGVGVVKFGVETLIDASREAQNVRNSSGGMSDNDLISGFKNRNNSVGERVGYLQALKDRHKR